MNSVIPKTVRFSDVPTIRYIEVDRAERQGYWAIDAARFRDRGFHLLRILRMPPAVTELTYQEKLFIDAVETNRRRLITMKNTMPGIVFYRILFSILLNSPIFEEIKSTY